ncbi:hypothetical protein HDU80_000695 [Chytriomyces hyalinus]|nr:hypothetical protein HDU80_000695 [Chytriomyces hyalinus]
MATNDSPKPVKRKRQPSRQRDEHPRSSSAALLAVLLSVSSAALLATRIAFALPEPVTHTDPHNLAFSEAIARTHVSALAEDIGLRLVGSRGEKRAQEYIESALDTIRRDAVSGMQFDVDVQVAHGSHRFDFMHEIVMKDYVNVTNVVARVSCGPECDKNAILVNAHYDSQMGTPGACDDATPIAVMLELARIVSKRDPKTLRNSLILLFNGAEESLQDGSHAFSKFHPWARTVRSFVNLEAMGNSGKEILFQANSMQLVEAYGASVPRPHGAVSSNDLFKTGLILSDTDYRQFVEYGAMVGVDMAIYQNSYLYHTMQDTAENIEPGLLQHMGENTLAVVEHLLTKAEIETFKEGRDFVYFDLFDKFFFVISTNIANRIYAVLIVVSFLELIRPYLLAATSTVPTLHQNPKRSITLYLKTSGFMVCSFLAAIIVPAVVGAFTQYLLQKPLLYYRAEWHAFLIFLPASLAGIFACHKFARFVSPPHPLDTPTAVERRIFTATFTVNTLIILILTSAGLGSGFIFALNQASHLLALMVDRLLNRTANKSIPSPIHPLAYAVAAFLPAYVAVAFSWNFLMLFVPLAGRMGPDAPVDIIVGVLIGLLAATGGVGWIVGCLSARSVAEVRTAVGTRSKRTKGVPDVVNAGAGIGSLACFCAVMILMFRGNVYDVLHPKRLFIQYLQNVTSKSEMIVISHADPTSIAPLAASVSQALGNAPYRATSNSSENDHFFATLFPFSHFLQVYMFDMGKTDEHGGGSGVPGVAGVLDDPLPDLEVEEVWYDEEQSVRTVRIKCYHPQHTSPNLHFHADLVSWSLSSPPQQGPQNHIIRHVGGYPSNYFNVTISFKSLPPSDPNRDLVYIHVSAIERDTWDGLEPYSKSRRVFGGGKRGDHAWVWRNGYRSGQVLRRVVEAVEGYTQVSKRGGGGEWAGWTTEMYMAVDTVTKAF